MRKKRDYVILTFRTTTDAMAMEAQCAACGIAGRLIPIPREITAGCGLAWRMPTEEYPLYENKTEMQLRRCTFRLSRLYR